jgi:hypothetical protein
LTLITPVKFTTQSFSDICQFASEDDQEGLFNGIPEHLGKYPELGDEEDAPDRWARSIPFGEYRVYYELIAGPPQRVRILRVVPVAFGKVPLEP